MQFTLLPSHRTNNNGYLHHSIKMSVERDGTWILDDLRADIWSIPEMKRLVQGLNDRNYSDDVSTRTLYDDMREEVRKERQRQCDAGNIRNGYLYA